MLRFQAREDRGKALLALQGRLVIRRIDQQILRANAGAGQAEYLLLLRAKRSRQSLQFANIVIEVEAEHANGHASQDQPRHHPAGNAPAIRLPNLVKAIGEGQPLFRPWCCRAWPVHQRKPRHHGQKGR